MFEPVDLLAIVLALAVLIGCVNHLWVRLPPAIGMLLGSLVVSLLIVSSDRVFHLHVMSWFRGTLDAAHLPRVFLNAVLALLLFAGSLHVDVAELNRRRWIILLLATASVILSTLIFGGGMWLMFGLIGTAVPFAWCTVLGAILAPTDAVVVENLLRQVTLPTGLRAAIVGESLFNDGAGVVLFLLALGVTEGDTLVLGHGMVLVALLREIVGGAVLGFAGGWVAAELLRRASDDGLRLLISLTLVIGIYRVANLAELSGPIAVVSAGLMPGVAVAALRHDAGDAGGADGILVFARSAHEHAAVPARRIANPRACYSTDRAGADSLRHPARGAVADGQCRSAAAAFPRANAR